MKKTWRSHLVVGEEGIVVLIDAKVDDVSPVKIYLRILLNEEPDMEAETLPPLLANIPAGLATSVLNIKHFPFEPKLWNHPDDHLAKLFQILVVTLIQETELRCFRTLRANASEIFIFQQLKEVFQRNVKSWLTLHLTLGNDCSCSSRPWEELYKSYKWRVQLKCCFLFVSKISKLSSSHRSRSFGRYFPPNFLLKSERLQIGATLKISQSLVNPYLSLYSHSQIFDMFLQNPICRQTLISNHFQT